MLAASAEKQCARLFIPWQRQHMNAIKWRFKLIQQEEIFPAEKLQTILERSTKNSKEPLTPEERESFSRAVRSERFEIDEFERAVLLAIALISQKEGISDELAVRLSKTLRVFYAGHGGPMEKFIEDEKRFINETKATLKSYAESLLKHDGARIRSYLALKELGAVVAPDTMLPHLVSISPRYLSCNFAQRWLRLQQYRSMYGTLSEARISNLNLKALAKSILGDRRKNKKRERSYWKTSFIYDDLFGHAEGFRRQMKEGNFDPEYFEAYCKQTKIPRSKRGLILNTKIAPAEVAIDIMIDQGQIHSEKTLREIQTKISKIQTRHFGGDILQIAEDVRPVVFQLIDLPGSHPEFVAKFDLLSCLENVELKAT